MILSSINRATLFPSIFRLYQKIAIAFSTKRWFCYSLKHAKRFKTQITDGCEVRPRILDRTKTPRPEDGRFRLPANFFGECDPKPPSVKDIRSIKCQESAGARLLITRRPADSEIQLYLSLIGQGNDIAPIDDVLCRNHAPTWSGRRAMIRHRESRCRGSGAKSGSRASCRSSSTQGSDPPGPEGFKHRPRQHVMTELVQKIPDSLHNRAFNDQ